jgi:ubiquinone biosynthesis protein
MIDFLRIFTIMAKYQIFTYLGPKKLNLFFFVLGRIYEIMLFPIRRSKYKSKTLGEALLKTLQNAGPIYIKFGQTLSTRPDIIGEEVAESLRRLQDKLPPFSFEKVSKTIEDEFNKPIKDIFTNFDPIPVAAASISQVHKATLKDGKEVAVKILRPNIRKQYERDLKLLYFFAKLSMYFLKDAKRLKPLEIIDMSRNIMNNELDLVIEAASSGEMRDNAKNDGIVAIPQVYWQYTTSRILTAEWIDAISIYDTESIKKAGLDTLLIAQKIATMFFNQAYRDGLFHADLHPGNIMVTKEGKIALVDFGIVGRLPEKDRLAVAEILYAFLNKDYKRIAQIHVNVGYSPPDTNLAMFALNCRALGEPMVGRPLKDISIANLLSQLFKITKDFGMETQVQLLLLQKTTVVVEGIGRMLNPELNMWHLAEPWIKKWAVKNISPEAKILRILKGVVDKLSERFV